MKDEMRLSRYSDIKLQELAASPGKLSRFEAGQLMDELITRAMLGRSGTYDEVADLVARRYPELSEQRYDGPDHKGKKQEGPFREPSEAERISRELHVRTISMMRENTKLDYGQAAQRVLDEDEGLRKRYGAPPPKR